MKANSDIVEKRGLKPTLKYIAERCNVSIATVSLAIHKPSRISTQVREKIMRVVLECGYFRKHSPVNLKILVVFNRFRDYFFGEYYHSVVYSIFHRLMEKESTIQIADDFLLDFAKFYDCTGIIFVGPVPFNWVTRAQRYGIPFVLCGHPYNNGNFPNIVPDFEGGYQLILEYIISCGHKRIGLITGKFEKGDALQAIIFETFQNALVSHHLRVVQKAIVSADYADLQTLPAAFHKILAIKPKVTAIQFSDDQFAYQAMREAERNGIRIPEDLSIVGFDGVPLPWFIEPPSPTLTTVRVPLEELGKKSVDILFELIQNPKSEIGCIKIPVQLQIGNSVRRT